MRGDVELGTTSNEVFAELPPDEIVFGSSEAMRRVRDLIGRLAGTRIPMLIQGESGTGKEVIAKFAHLSSLWKSGPFVKVSCAAIPSALLETELFGYEKGAFTGAFSTKRGRVELADGGTLLLDEIAELDVGLQAKLLQLLQDGVFSRVGGQVQRQVKVRVICTTNRQLMQEISDGTFRQDLFYRIHGVSVCLPPLRDRAEDIPLMADYLLEKYNQMFGTGTRALSAKLHHRLKEHFWPGNIRELENVVRRYAILGTPEAISEQVNMRPSTFVYFELPLSGDLSLKALTQRALRELETKMILNVLRNNKWNRKKSAEVLDISYRSLLYKIRNAGIDVAHHESADLADGATHLGPASTSEDLGSSLAAGD